MQLSPDTRLDRYDIRSLLGTGGMGEVYLAQDMILFAAGCKAEATVAYDF